MKDLAKNIMAEHSALRMKTRELIEAISRTKQRSTTRRTRSATSGRKGVGAHSEGNMNESVDEDKDEEEDLTEILRG